MTLKKYRIGVLMRQCVFNFMRSRFLRCNTIEQNYMTEDLFSSLTKRATEHEKELKRLECEMTEKFPFHEPLEVVDEETHALNYGKFDPWSNFKSTFKWHEHMYNEERLKWMEVLDQLELLFEPSEFTCPRCLCHVEAREFESFDKYALMRDYYKKCKDCAPRSSRNVWFYCD